MRINHTPGPWQSSYRQRKNHYLIYRENKVHEGINIIAKVSKLEDAKLITTAPDLLQALISARDELAKHIVFVEHEELISEINNAIVKATK